MKQVPSMEQRTGCGADAVGAAADDGRRMLLGLAGLGGVAALAGMARGGPLDPPAGAVAGTGRTLAEIHDRVEARPDGVPIGSTTTPGAGGALYRITQPGRYYFPAGQGPIVAPTGAGCWRSRRRTWTWT